MVRIARLDYAFSGIHELEATKVEVQQLQQKEKKIQGEKGKARKKTEQPNTKQKCIPANSQAL